ncbi:DeoR/GlpR family DNA-binding transcription regulator [Planctomycetota bacterium]
MTRNERQKLILDYLTEHKAATYADIECIVEVSNMTIRRDIDSLAEDGKVIKTIGGAQIAGASPDIYESDVLTHLAEQAAEKKAIAAEAVEYIKQGEIIYLDGSSTCWELAKRIAEQKTNITVVTNSMLVHMELAKGKDISIINLGGQHDPVSYCMIGSHTEEQAQQYFIEKAFFSTKGFSPIAGTFESSVAGFRIKQVVASKSSEVVLLVDHTKFGQKGLCKVLDISQINTVFTDSGTKTRYIDMLKENGKNVIVSEVNEAFTI